MSADFVKVAETKDILPSNMKAVDTLLGGPLNEGTLERYEVEYPWHGSKFDVRTGEPTKPPARQAVPKYEVKVEENNLLVRKQ